MTELSNENINLKDKLQQKQKEFEEISESYSTVSNQVIELKDEIKILNIDRSTEEMGYITLFDTCCPQNRTSSVRNMNYILLSSLLNL